MKGSEIQAGKRYAAKVDYTEHVVVDVLEVGVARSHGYRGGKRKDGVRVRIAHPYSRWGSTISAGAEKTITTRDVDYEWTPEHQQRREAREAEAKELDRRAGAIRDALIEARIDGTVTHNRVHLSFDDAEKLLGITSAAPPRIQHESQEDAR